MLPDITIAGYTFYSRYSAKVQKNPLINLQPAVIASRVDANGCSSIDLGLRQTLFNIIDEEISYWRTGKGKGLSF